MVKNNLRVVRSKTYPPLYRPIQESTGQRKNGISQFALGVWYALKSGQPDNSNYNSVPTTAYTNLSANRKKANIIQQISPAIVNISVCQYVIAR